MEKELPLLDKRILVPRGKQQAKSFSRLVEKYGGIPVEIPLLAFRPIERNDVIHNAILKLPTYNWLIFTSNVTVETFFSLLDDSPLPKNIKIAVIGERTEKVLLSKGIVVDFVPKEFVAEAFVEEFLAEVHPGDQVLIPKGNLARDHISEVLRRHGAIVDEVVVYETFLPDESREQLAKRLSDGVLDVLLFTSPSTIDHFMEVVEQHKLHDRLQKCIIGCIGPVTHARITKHELKVHIMPEKYTVEDLVDSTVSFFEKRKA